MTAPEPRTDFQPLETSHQAPIRCVAYNATSTRLLTASADHRIKVYRRISSSAQWSLLDTFRAHDASLLSALFLPSHLSPPSLSTLATVASDSKFKIWVEDGFAPPLSGHRFRCVYTLHAPGPAHSPYMSFDVKSCGFDETMLALLNAEGTLCVYETNDPESLMSWCLSAEFAVVEERPVRGEEGGGVVKFCPDVWVGVEGLGILTAAGVDGVVRMWRRGGAGSWHRVLEIGGEGGLIRDIAWSGGGAIGHDLVATASKDGGLRIYQIEMHTGQEKEVLDGNGRRESVDEGLDTSGERWMFGSESVDQSLHGESPPRTKYAIELVTHVLKTSGSGGVWSVKWSPISEEFPSFVDAAKVTAADKTSAAIDGMELYTAGDDGKIRVWKGTISGDWAEYAVVQGGDKRR